jgi:O-antigen/teichoic acid export membrane protein
MGSWRWTARVIGFASTLIIARLLSPDDFGIVATALLVVRFFDILIDLGTDTYLIRLPDPKRDDYDTAWTLRLLVIAAASAVIFVTAAPAAHFFGESRLVAVLQLMAFACLMRGFVNIGLTMYRKNLRFGRLAFVGLVPRFGWFVTVVVLAFILRNYWAVVIAEVALRAVELVMSYAVHGYRPRWCLKTFAKQWDFSKWIVSRSVAMFVQGRGDQLAVAKFFGIEQIGLYAMAVRFGELPTKHLMAPVLMPAYSGLAKKQGNRADFTHGILQLVSASWTVFLPVATLCAVLSEDIVHAVLGGKWEAAAPLMAPVVFQLVAAVLGEPAVTALTLAGRVRFLAVLHWCSAAAIGIVMPAVALAGSLELVAWARMLLAVVLLAWSYYCLRGQVELTWSRLFVSVYRPICAALAMAIAAAAVQLLALGAWPTLVVAGLLSGTVYIFVLYALWRAAGCPQSGDALLARRMYVLLSRSRATAQPSA